MKNHALLFNTFTRHFIVLNDDFKSKEESYRFCKTVYGENFIFVGWL